MTTVTYYWGDYGWGGDVTQKVKRTQNFSLKIWEEETVTTRHSWADNIKIDRREAKPNSVMWLWVGTNWKALVSEVMKLKMERFFVACISNVTPLHAVSYKHHQHRRGAYSGAMATTTNVLHVPRSLAKGKTSTVQPLPTVLLLREATLSQ
jgi:hypothetical protein